MQTLGIYKSTNGTADILHSHSALLGINADRPTTGATVLALPDIEVNGIDDSNTMAAGWWA